MSSFLTSDLTNFLKVYTDFAFLLFVSPVRFCHDPKTCTYFPKSWWPQKIMSGTASFLSVFWLLQMIRVSIPTGDEKNASLYFALVLNVIGLSMKSVTIKNLWWNHKNLVEILNFTVRNSANLPLEMHASRKVVVFFICLMYTFVGLTNCITGRGLGHISEWSVSWWRNGVTRAACFNFFLTNSSCTTITMSRWGWVIGVPSAIGFYQRHIVSLYSELFLLSGVLTLWTCTRSYALLLRKDIEYFSNSYDSNDNNSDSTTDILVFTKKWMHSSHISPGYDRWLLRHRQYRTLQRLVDLINSTFGTNMTLFLTDAILYYSTSFTEVFIQDSSHHDASKVFRLMFFFFNTCAILAFSADIPTQITSAMKEWLATDGIKGNIPIDQLHIYINDLDMNVVAVKASGIFPVTFPVIAQMLAVTVTYFVICIEN